MITDHLISAISSLWANKLRSFLTVLSVVIGIYAVVTLLSVVQGVQNQITDQVEGLGPRTILLLPGESDSEGAGINIAAQLAPSTIKISDVALIKSDANLIDPDSIDYATILGGALSNGSKKVNALPMGATPGIAKNLGYLKLAEGREMTADDISSKSKVLFINRGTANKLAAKVDDKVMLGKNEFVVKGIYEDPETAGLSPADTQNVALMPISVASDILGSDQISRIIVKAKEVERVNDAKIQITNLISQKHGATDFTVMLSSDLLKSITKITDILKYAVVGIAAISLLVGGIGISNIMLVSVTERTREIGLRKAVGATEGAIMFQFLVESVLLTVIGSAIGITLALVSGQLLKRFSPLEPLLTWSTIALALAMGAVAGIIFGLFPAFRAARKNPVEALRFE